MSDEEAKIIAEPIYKLAEAILKLACAVENLGGIAEDKPLNYSVGRGLDKIAEAIKEMR